MRYSLEKRKDEFHVIVTTYKLATGQKEDRGFLKSFNFDVYSSLIASDGLGVYLR
jgi:SNF2 family DNA or RNA helicase